MLRKVHILLSKMHHWPFLRIAGFSAVQLPVVKKSDCRKVTGVFNFGTRGFKHQAEIVLWLAFRMNSYIKNCSCYFRRNSQRTEFCLFTAKIAIIEKTKRKTCSLCSRHMLLFSWAYCVYATVLLKMLGQTQSCLWQFSYQRTPFPHSVLRMWPSLTLKWESLKMRQSLTG